VPHAIKEASYRR